MKRFFVSVLLFLPVFVLSGVAFAAGPSGMYLKAGLETRYIAAGETINNKSFDCPGCGGLVESELEFPLEGNFLGGVNLEFGTLFEEDRGNKPATKLSFTYLQAIDGSKGIMRDSDWISVDTDPPYSQASVSGGRDRFTKSDDELTSATMFDANFTYNIRINEQLTVAPVFGYMSQNFKHDVRGGDGAYWGVPVSLMNVTQIDFENDSDIPYLGVNSEVFFGEDDKSSLSLSLLYSGWVGATYTDIHRSPVTAGTDEHYIGDLDGEAYIARLNMDWYLSESWFFGVGGEYLEIKTEGKEKQITYETGFPPVVSTAKIDSELDTTMLSVNLRLGYTFF